MDNNTSINNVSTQDMEKKQSKLLESLLNFKKAISEIKDIIEAKKGKRGT